MARPLDSGPSFSRGPFARGRSERVPRLRSGRVEGRRRVIITAATSTIVAAAVLLKIFDTRYPWLWAYLADRVRPQEAQAAPGPTHILFTFVDHFEPHDQATMDRWMYDYPALTLRHHDADGIMPQHSWFWFFAKSDGAESLRFLQQLARLTYDGFGEVELHLHHNHDTPPTFLAQIGRMIQLSRWTGAMVTAELHPRVTFGFIHGMWALDNSRNARTGEDCGINNELLLLRQLGCYADFTHPSWGPMHPRIVNRFYYATDDPQRPKSYDTGVIMHVGGTGVGDLLLMEGPSVVRLRGLRPTYDHGDVRMELADRPTPGRVDDWIRTGIHVQGRPEWIFVRVFTHGAIAADHDAVLGVFADRMYTYLEQHYNDGTRYVLHYVTAREAYNIAKAAEAGKTGNPNAYRDFLIPPYVNRSMTSSAPYDALSWTAQRIIVRFLAPPGTPVEVHLKQPNVAVVGDAIVRSHLSSEYDTALLLTLHDEEIVEFDLQPHAFAAQKHNKPQI